MNTLKGHTDEITCIELNASSDILISGSIDNTVRIWNVKTAKCLLTLEGFNI